MPAHVTSLDMKSIAARLRNVKPDAAAAFEQALVLANAAQVPVFGGVFAVALEVVRAINVRTSLFHRISLLTLIY